MSTTAALSPRPLQLPVTFVLLAAAAALIAGVQWLLRRMRTAESVRPAFAASPELAERFGLRAPARSALINRV